MSPEDYEQVRDFLGGEPGTAEVGERCSVVGDPECIIRDLVFLKLALDESATSVEPRCDAALSPPPQ
jgi:hypothetical protein